MGKDEEQFNDGEADGDATTEPKSEREAQGEQNN
jgi:hypothetical protein